LKRICTVAKKTALPVVVASATVDGLPTGYRIRYEPSSWKSMLLKLEDCEREPGTYSSSVAL